MPERVKEQEKDIAIKRETKSFTDEKPLPKPSSAEVKDFARIWEYYRRNDPRWPIERDRFKRRSDAAGDALAGHLLRHYINVNKVRDKAGRELVRVKNELVEVGQPVAPFLVEMMVLDEIETKDGHMWRVDDITRKDCLDICPAAEEPPVVGGFDVSAKLGDGSQPAATAATPERNIPLMALLIGLGAAMVGGAVWKRRR